MDRGDRLVQLADHLLRHARGAAIAADGFQNIDMGDVLKRPHIRLRPGGATTDQEERRSGKRRIGHAGNAIGDPRSRGRHDDAEGAGELGVSMRHVHGGPLVTHVDNADAQPRRMIPNRLDMATLQAEDAIDAAFLQRLVDPAATLS